MLQGTTACLRHIHSAHCGCCFICGYVGRVADLYVNCVNLQLAAQLQQCNATACIWACEQLHHHMLGACVEGQRCATGASRNHVLCSQLSKACSVLYSVDGPGGTCFVQITTPSLLEWVAGAAYYNIFILKVCRGHASHCLLEGRSSGSG